MWAGLQIENSLFAAASNRARGALEFIRRLLRGEPVIERLVAPDASAVLASSSEESHVLPCEPPSILASVAASSSLVTWG
jgi:hypothetical protein